jgi:hypothetical protein
LLSTGRLVVRSALAVLLIAWVQCATAQSAQDRDGTLCRSAIDFEKRVVVDLSGRSVAFRLNHEGDIAPAACEDETSSWRVFSDGLLALDREAVAICKAASSQVSKKDRAKGMLAAQLRWNQMWSSLNRPSAGCRGELDPYVSVQRAQEEMGIGPLMRKP